MWTVLLILACVAGTVPAQEGYEWEEEPESKPVTDGYDGDYYDLGHGFEDGSGSGAGEFARGQYAITLKQKFKTQMLDQASAIFTRVSNDVISSLSHKLVSNTYIADDEVTVGVVKMEPGPGISRTQTRVIVDVEFITDLVLQSDLDFQMEQLIRGRLGRYRVIDVTEIPIVIDTPAPVIQYQAEIMYKKPFVRQLNNKKSAAFLQQKKAVESELLLQLVIQQTIPEVDIEQIEVQSFKPARRRRSTVATVNLHLSNMDDSSVELALDKLVGVNIAGKRIIRATYLGSGVPRGDTTDATPAPPLDTTLSPVEPTPPDVEPTPPDVEPTPPDVEPIPPDAVTTPEQALSCKTIRNPEYGGVRCTDDNTIGSVCNFWCNSGTYLAGANQITCTEDGHWSRDAPFCIRVFCEPHFEVLENGDFLCTAHNTYDSFCTFECNDGYQLNGEPTSTCQSSGVWSSPLPACELIPIDCVVQFGNWGECADGIALRPAVITVQPNAAGRQCPDPIPVQTKGCSNCKVAWQAWSGCSDGLRSRSEAIITQARGGGRECPAELRSEDEVCVHCVVDWSDWGECANGLRSRSMHVVTAAVGAGNTCPDLQDETEECIDCVVEWGDWGECANDMRHRTQQIVQEPIGAGKQCRDLTMESEACIDCLVGWGVWGECANGQRARSEKVLVSKVGAGADCPALTSQTEECVDCVVGWGEWSACSNDLRTRSQVVTTPKVGAGQDCPNLDTETEICIDCQLEWGPWGECSNDERTRSQRIAVAAVGAGAQCDQLNSESEACIDCVIDWGNWGECANNVRSRSQVVVTESQGAGKSCPSLDSESEACIDCIVEWSDWGECSDGSRSRSQRVVVESMGAGQTCQNLRTETEECRDCVVEWSEWSKCTDYVSQRILIVLQDRVGAGRDCPSVRKESEDCFDCELIWENWGPCTEADVRTRQMTIIAEEIGRGLPCPAELPTEEEACRNCTVEWGPWGECANGERARSQVEALSVIGQGAPCPLLDRQTEECVDCTWEWGDWGVCENGSRERSQVVTQNKVGAGSDCPVLSNDSEECLDCELTWADWGECLSGVRHRLQYRSREKVGAGLDCPELDTQSESCQDCVVAWGDWSQCDGSNRQRSMIIKQDKVGAGRACPDLTTETEACQDCVTRWRDYGPCINSKMTRNEYVSQPQIGAGAACPSTLQSESQACANCVVDWSDWSECSLVGKSSRTQVITVEAQGTGKPCPQNLRTENKFCIAKIQSTSAPSTSTAEPVPSGSTLAGETNEDVLCRFVRTFLGYGSNPRLRDILLLADESGSIGWINYEKVKSTFQMVARSIQGGIGEQESQIGMMSFAKWGNLLFNFDQSHDVNGVVEAIGRSVYRGGHRSNIGRALQEANAWMFQQSAGMRGFPGRDDNIDHEIIIATDGCRTSTGYFLNKGLKKIKKRGIKLSVLAIYARDPRCQETVRNMVDDPSDLYEIGTWEELDNFNRRVENGECRP